MKVFRHESLTDAWLLGSLNESSLLFPCALIPKILLSFCSCHLCTLLFSTTHGYQAKEAFGEDNGDYWHSQNCDENIWILSKHLEPGVPQRTISAACYCVGELCSGGLCSLSRLALGTTVCKQALAGVFLFRKRPPNALCDNERNNFLWNISSLYSKSHI